AAAITILHAILLPVRALTHPLEPLATLGDSLALARAVVSGSGTTMVVSAATETFDVGAFNAEEIHLLEVDACGQLVRFELFAENRLGEAVARLYERYAELLPVGPARDRATATARSVATLLGPIDLDRWATAFAPGIEYVDNRTVGLGPVHGADALLRSSRAMLELLEDVAGRVDDTLDLRSNALLFRWTSFGTDRTSGGIVDRPVCQLGIFGADGLLTRLEQSEADRDDAALARFDQLMATIEAPSVPPARPVRRVPPNTASATVARVEAAVAARDAEAFSALYADGAQ